MSEVPAPKPDGEQCRPGVRRLQLHLRATLLLRHAGEPCRARRRCRAHVESISSPDVAVSSAWRRPCVGDDAPAAVVDHLAVRGMAPCGAGRPFRGAHEAILGLAKRPGISPLPAAHQPRNGLPWSRFDGWPGRSASDRVSPELAMSAAVPSPWSSSLVHCEIDSAADIPGKRGVALIASRITTMITGNRHNIPIQKSASKKFMTFSFWLAARSGGALARGTEPKV